MVQFGCSSLSSSIYLFFLKVIFFSQLCQKIVSLAFVRTIFCHWVLLEGRKGCSKCGSNGRGNRLLFEGSEEVRVSCSTWTQINSLISLMCRLQSWGQFAPTLSPTSHSVLCHLVGEMICWKTQGPGSAQTDTEIVLRLELDCYWTRCAFMFFSSSWLHCSCLAHIPFP